MKILLRHMSRLCADTGAYYAIAFALLASALLVAAGGTLDMIRFYEARSRLKDAVDATTLMVAGRYRAGETTADAVDAMAKSILATTFQSKDAVASAVTTTMTTSDVTVSATIDLETYFLKIIGLTKLDTTAASTASWAATSIEVVLVLDTTGSMLESDKIGQMRTAASAMVDAVFAKAGPGATVRFGLVPFAHFVNVGPSFASATWIDQGGAARSSYYDTYFSTHINRLTTYTSLGKAWKGCVETRPAPYDVDDTAPSTANPNTLFVPSFHPDEPDTWNGYYGNTYLGDKSWSDDWTRMVNAAKYTSPISVDFSNSTLYSNYSAPKGPDFLCSSTPLTRLTTSAATVKTAIGALNPAGSTNIPEGLAWGWRVLSPRGPFADGTSYGASDNRKVLVLLTDGTNAINTFPTALGGAYSSWGFPASGRLGAAPGTDLRDGLDAKTRSVCSKIKAAGITVYTIGLMISDAAGQQLLYDCSSGTGHYYDSPSAGQLQSVFDDIAKKISKLRISS